MQQASQLGWCEVGVLVARRLKPKPEACMLYVGLDVHSKQSSLCILNSAGGTVNQIQLKGPRAAVVGRLRQTDQPFSICYEASCGYGHLYEALRPIAHHVAVAHPGKLRLIYKSNRARRHHIAGTAR